MNQLNTSLSNEHISRLRKNNLEQNLHLVDFSRTNKKDIHLNSEMHSILLSNKKGFVNWNAKESISIFNKAICNILNYNHSEANYLIEPNSLVHPDDQSRFVSTFREIIINPNKSVIHQFRFKHKDGAWRWIESTFTNLLPSIGVEAIVVNYRDISHGKEFEEELKIAKKIFEHSIDMLCVAGFDGYFKVLNPAWSKTLGWSTEELLSKPWISYVHAGDIDATSQIKSVIINGQEIFQFKNRYICKDGSIKWLSWNTFPYPAENIMFGVARDVTDMINAENEIRELNDELESRVIKRTAQLEDANKNLEAFSYSVSHDLRSPLRAISGFSKILIEEYSEDLKPEMKRLLVDIISNSLNMNQLIDDLLEFSRLGRKKIRKVSINMTNLFQEIFDELKVLENKRVVILKLKNLHAGFGDYSLIKQVIKNLLSNAIKYTSKKTKAVITIDSLEKENEVIYSVSDNGVGFDMKYVEKIFVVFQRLHSKNEFEGTGVGLAIAKNIITRHGGKIWVESRINEGTKFYFSLEKNEVLNDN